MWSYSVEKNVIHLASTDVDQCREFLNEKVISTYTDAQNGKKDDTHMRIET